MGIDISRARARVHTHTHTKTLASKQIIEVKENPYIGVCVYFNINCDILVLQLSIDMSEKQFTFLCSRGSDTLQEEKINKTGVRFTRANNFDKHKNPLKTDLDITNQMKKRE